MSEAELDILFERFRELFTKGRIRGLNAVEQSELQAIAVDMAAYFRKKDQ